MFPPLDDDIPSPQWTVYPWETPHSSTKKLSSNPHSWQGRHVSWREGMAIMEFKFIVNFPPGRVTITWLGGSKCWFWPQHGAVTSCSRQTWFSKWDWQLRTPHVGKSKNNSIHLYIYIYVRYHPFWSLLCSFQGFDPTTGSPTQPHKNTFFARHAAWLAPRWQRHGRAGAPNAMWRWGQTHRG